MDVTLYTVPLYKVKAYKYMISDDILTKGTAIEWAKISDSIMFYWFPTLDEVIVVNYTFVTAETPGNAWDNLIPKVTYESSVASTIYKELAYNLSTSACVEASTLGMTALNYNIFGDLNTRIIGYEMLHVAEMSSEQSSLRQIPRNVSIGIGADYPSSAVGYPHEMFTSVCREDVGPNEEACSWAHANPYSIETLDNELVK